MPWNPQAFGTEADPIRQSDLKDITSEFGCPKKFWFRKREEAGEYVGREDREDVNHGDAHVGNAVHLALARYLERHGERICAGDLPREQSVMRTLEACFAEVAEGRPVRWGKRDAASETEAAFRMVTGGLRTFAERASVVELVEAHFRVEFHTPEGVGRRPQSYHLEGTIDLVFRDKDGRLCLADWKTKQQRPAQVELDHGYQLALYSFAVEHGVFAGGIELGERPEECFIVHLRDLVPYEKATRKQVKRPEEAAFYGVEPGAFYKATAGELRGPAWYRSNRTPEDDRRFRESLASIVAGVRFRNFYERVGDLTCARCAYRSVCLTEGHGPDVQEQRLLRQLRKSVEQAGGQLGAFAEGKTG